MIGDCLHRVAACRESLTREEARAVMAEILRGETTDAQIAGLLVALNIKGESVEEIVGFAEAIRSAATPLESLRTEAGALDVSGTERYIPTTSLPPELQGDIAAMAASLPGVVLIPGLDGGPDGFSVMGLGADQNSVTLNGLAYNAH